MPVPESTVPESSTWKNLRAEEEEEDEEEEWEAGRLLLKKFLENILPCRKVEN